MICEDVKLCEECINYNNPYWVEPCKSCFRKCNWQPKHTETKEGESNDNETR